MKSNECIGLLSRLGPYFSGCTRDYGRRLAFSVMGIMTAAIAGHVYISYQAKKLQDAVYNWKQAKVALWKCNNSKKG